MNRKRSPMSPRSILRRTWIHMVARCNDPKEQGYLKYGARGIKVCDRWLDFENFLADMGLRPEGMTLDRIDSKLGYYPENCRWASWAVQIRNRSITNNLTHDGKTMCIKDWADGLGMKYSTLKSRLQAGWAIDRALTIPASASNSRFNRSYRDLATGGTININTRPYKGCSVFTDGGDHG